MSTFRLSTGFRLMLVACVVALALGALALPARAQGLAQSIRAENLPPNWASINTGWLNMRSGPGTLYSYVSKAKFGTNVVLVGRAMNTWVQIQVPGGAMGWVNRAYLLTTVDYATLPMTWNDVIAETPPDPAKFWAPVAHTVQAGETLLSIATLYNMSWHTLATINGLPNPSYIYVGQTLIIRSGGPGDWPAWANNGAAAPAAPVVPPPATARYHIVQYGETLASIGMVYGMSWTALASANNLWNPNLIYAGQTLIIP